MTKIIDIDGGGVGGGDTTSATGVLIRLRESLPSLSAAEQAIARFVLASPGRLSSASISTLAKEAGVSDTTVTRFSRSLGFSGYPEFRLAVCLADDRQRSEAFRVGADTAVDAADSMADVAGKVAQAETRALQDTRAQLDLDAVDAVVRAVSAAPRVAVFGVGSSAFVAADLEFKLRRAGVSSFATTDVHRALSEASHLTPGDVAIAISHSGRTRETLEPLREAGERGATTVVLTHDARSAMAQLSQHVLTTAGREPSARSGATVSRMAQLFVVDCLYARLVQKLEPRRREAFERAEDAARRHNRQSRVRSNRRADG